MVSTDAGPVRGTATEKYRLFQGIPYAAPPVGDRRWRSPQPVQPWTGIRDATQPGSRCPQEGDAREPRSTNEDCLYVNVMTPRSDPERPRPVMVWLHGGTGTGAGSDFDPWRFVVQGDVVLVTINYRMTVFGAFAHPDLPDSGAFGLEDQQAALRWVQRNAHAFGGDPGNVTLFGESRGSLSTCEQMTSPSARGLFHRAIMQSGACTWNWPAGGLFPGLPAGSIWAPVEAGAQAGSDLAASRGCATVDCLRKIPAGGDQGLVNPATLGRFAFTLFGNSVLPTNPTEATLAGQVHDIPVMIGSTQDEMRLFVNDYWPQVTAESYNSLLQTAFGDKAGVVARRYPLGNYVSPDIAWSAVTTDRVFACTVLRSTEALARKVPTYGFEFADRDAPDILADKRPPRFDLGAYHASDTLYTVAYDVEFTLNPEQQIMNDQVIRYWTNFARTGDPNGPGLPQWPLFQTGRQVQQLKPEPGGFQRVDLGAEHNCAFWSDIGR